VKGITEAGLLNFVAIGDCRMYNTYFSMKCVEVDEKMNMREPRKSVNRQLSLFRRVRVKIALSGFGEISEHKIYTWYRYYLERAIGRIEIGRDEGAKISYPPPSNDVIDIHELVES
jgi:hypothetical protein